MLQNTNVKERNLKKINLSFYPDSHQKLLGSIWGQDPSSIQVLWLSILQFLCKSAEEPTTQQTNKRE